MGTNKLEIKAVGLKNRLFLFAANYSVLKTVSL